MPDSHQSDRTRLKRIEADGKPIGLHQERILMSAHFFSELSVNTEGLKGMPLRRGEVVVLR